MRSQVRQLGWQWMLGALVLCGLYACDTARNVENPELHYFLKYYGGDGDQRGVDMEMLSDGSFLLLGNYTNNEFDTDIYLVRVDSEGEVIWEKKFSEQANNNAKDLEPTTDGNFIILADFDTPDSLSQLKLLKVTPDGNLLDSVTFGTEANDYSRSVTSVSDGGFIVSGTTEFTSTFKLVNNPDPDLGDFSNYRFDQNLNSFSSSNWFPVSPGFGGKLDVAVKIIQKADTLFYAFGYSNINLNNTNPDNLLGLCYFSRDRTGGATDPFFPGGEVNDIDIQFVHPVPAELGFGYLIVGTSHDRIAGSKIFLVRLRDKLLTNYKDDVLLYDPVPLNGNFRAVAATSSLTGPVGYLLLGNEERSTGTNIWLSKVDQSGIVLWSSTFGSEDADDAGAAIRELPDGKIVILGTMELADHQSKMSFIKVNPKGQLLK